MVRHQEGRGSWYLSIAAVGVERIGKWGFVAAAGNNSSLAEERAAGDLSIAAEGGRWVGDMKD